MLQWSNPTLSRFLLSVLLLSFSVACQAQESAKPLTKVGSYGAGFKASSSWRRCTLNTDLGNDQFTLTNQGICYLIIQEQEAVLDTEDDFRTTLEETRSSLATNPVSIAEMVFQQKGEQGHAFQVFNGEAKGLKVCYQIHVLSRAGLTYQLLFWSVRSNALNLTWEASQLAASFRFPKLDTPWAKSTIPKTYRFQAGPYELSFTARSSVFNDEGPHANLVDFISHDQSQEIHVIETTGYSFNDVLKEVLEIINEDYGEKPFKEVDRLSRKIDELDGRMIVCTNGEQTLHLLAVKLKRNNYLDIRYAASGVPTQSRFDRDLFLESLSLSKYDGGLELPELDQAGDPEPLNMYEKAVYERSELVGQTQLAYPHSCHLLQDSRFVVADSREVVLASDAGEDSTEELVYRTDQWKFDLQAVRWQGRWLVTGDDNHLLHVDAQVSEPAEIRGKFIAASGDRLFVATPPSEASLLGMTTEPLVGADVLMEYGPEKQGRQIALFPGKRVERFAVDGRVTSALVAVSQGLDLDNSTKAFRQLVVIDLASGQKIPLGDWRQVGQVCAAENWWLVTGQPRDLPQGIYRVYETGNLEPLLTGTNILGIALVDQELFFGSNRATEPQIGANYHIYKISLADLLPHGPLCYPFSEARLNRIASDWLTRHADGEMPAPRTEEDIRQLVDDASKVSKELVGRELPLTRQEVDSLCSSLSGSDQLSRPGRMLVTLLVTTCLLEQGAVWIESDGVTVMDWLVPESLESHSAFATGYTPASITSSILDDTEGYWNPCETIHSTAKGRKVVLGLKRSVVEEAVRNMAPGIDVEQIIRKGSAAEVISLFEAVPKNEHFRSIVYDQLAVETRRDVMREVTLQMANRPNATLVDKLAWSILRCSRLTNQDEAQLFAKDLHMLLEQHPNEAALYLLLGNVYEIATPETPQFSKMCYNRVLEISSWGKVADDATERLGALESSD